MKEPAVRMLLLVVGLAAGLLLACSGSGPALSDAEISLRREGLLELTLPPPTEYVLLEPGDAMLLARTSFGAPPMIPHTVQDLLLTTDTNDCLDCHEVKDADTPGVPPSHLVQAVFAVRPRERAVHGSTTVFEGYAKASPVTGQRYNCMLCHATQATNATELVGNTARLVEPSDAHDDALEGLKGREGRF